MALETYGRLGAESLQNLQVLALLAGSSIGDSLAMPRRQAALQRAGIFAVADADILALGGKVSSVAIAAQRARAVRTT